LADVARRLGPPDTTKQNLRNSQWPVGPRLGTRARGLAEFGSYDGVHTRQAAAATGAGAGLFGDGLGAVEAVMHGGSDGAIGDGSAVTDDHGRTSENMTHLKETFNIICKKAGKIAS